MLTYATLQQFKDIKSIKATDPVNAVQDAIYTRYLVRATHYMDRKCRRTFFPMIETRDFTIPGDYFDLRFRQDPTADLMFDRALLEVVEVKSGYPEAEADAMASTTYQLLPYNIWPKYGMTLVFPTMWQPDYFGYHDGLPSIFVNAFWGYHREFGTEGWISTNSIVTNSLNVSATTFVITQAETYDQFGFDGMKIGYLLRLEDEMLEVRDWDSDTATVTVLRGIRGSTAATHDASTAIDRWNLWTDIEELCLQVAKSLREQDESVGGRQGVSDISTGVEVDLPAYAKQMMASYTRMI